MSENTKEHGRGQARPDEAMRAAERAWEQDQTLEAAQRLSALRTRVGTRSRKALTYQPVTRHQLVRAAGQASTTKARQAVRSMHAPAVSPETARQSSE